MSFFVITSEPSRWARRGLLLLGGLLALGPGAGATGPATATGQYEYHR